MTIVGDEYRISFSSKDISQFNKIFATLLQNLTSVEELPDFKVNCSEERVIIRLPAHPESFSFIAEIIREIDDFSMSFVSNKTIVPVDTGTKKFKTDVTNTCGRNKHDIMHRDRNTSLSLANETGVGKTI